MPQTREHTDLLNAAARAVSRLRIDGARVHCLTNSVAQPLTANLLLAAGATPSMTMAREEIADFVSRADIAAEQIIEVDDARQTRLYCYRR